MVALFVYGTLKKGFGNHGVLGKSIYIDEAITNSQEFTMFNGAFPFVSDKNTHENAGRILGELYEVTEPEILVNLDRLEGVPSLYTRKDVEVTTLNNLLYNAIMYVASNGSNERLEKRIPMIPKGRSRVLEWED